MDEETKNAIKQGIQELEIKYEIQNYDIIVITDAAHKSSLEDKNGNSYGKTVSALSSIILIKSKTKLLDELNYDVYNIDAIDTSCKSSCEAEIKAIINASMFVYSNTNKNYVSEDWINGNFSPKVLIITDFISICDKEENKENSENLVYWNEKINGKLKYNGSNMQFYRNVIKNILFGYDVKIKFSASNDCLLLYLVDIRSKNLIHNLKPFISCICQSIKVKCIK